MDALVRARRRFKDASDEVDSVLAKRPIYEVSIWEIRQVKERFIEAVYAYKRACFEALGDPAESLSPNEVLLSALWPRAEAERVERDLVGAG